MGDVAIRVENLGKQYRIGGPQARYKTLRDSLSDAAAAPFRRISSVLRGESTNHRHETIWALKDVSFEVNKGEVVGIIGRNGAGKSTLLKVLSRITEPTEGTVDLFGRVGSLLEVGTGFHPELTGRENIYLNGAILGMKKVEIERKFDEIVDFSGVEKFIDTPVKHYSSGMYVRLAFAVAAHLDPEILLVDEVLAVGDATFQKKCMGKMRDVAHQGRTVLFVSHNMGVIHQLCPHCFWLENGRIKILGKTSRIIDAYLRSNTIIRNGEMNFPELQDLDAQLCRARLLNIAGELTQEFSCDEAVVLDLLFRVRRRIPGLYCWLDISKMDGTLVMMSDSFDTFPNPLDDLPIGLHNVRITIPARTLAHGDYLVNLRFTGLGGGATPVHSPGIICSFSLRDFTSQRGDARPGFFSTMPSWEVNKVL
jgi:lipopolysaccharide transport system ATP-binding protein